MGPWPHYAHHLTPELDVPLHCVSRPESASPAVGQASRHQEEQKNLVIEAFSDRARQPDPLFG
jgi:2-oxoglutarate dehydrogenase E1 component